MTTNTSDINRETEEIHVTVVDATLDEKAKIIFQSAEGIQLITILLGFDLGSPNDSYSKKVVVYVSGAMTDINADFEFQNNETGDTFHVTITNR